MWSKVWRFLVFGGFVGGLLSAWLAPKMIVWYFAPPVDPIINCKPALEWALRKMQIAQMVGFGAGALLGIALCLIFRNGRKPRLTGLPDGG